MLSSPLEWRVAEVRLQCSRDTDDTIRVEIEVVRERERRTFRFDGVVDLSIAQAVSGSSVRILDVTHLKWRGIDVRVESVCGSLGFWAEAVTIAGEASPEQPNRSDRAASSPPRRGRPTRSGS